MKKLRTTTPASISQHVKRGFLFFSAFTLVAAGTLVYTQTNNVSADQYEAKIRALEADISRYDAEAARLSQEADSLSREVSRLGNEKAVIQAQVDLSTAKLAKVNQEIKDNEKKLSDNRDVMGNILADIWVGDEVSAVEMLASSKGVNDFIDKQEYRSSTRDTLSETIELVKNLKAELEAQKKTVENILADQEGQRNLLASKEAEQASLLDKTKGDEAAYRNLSSGATAEKEKVQREQQAAIERALAASGGGGTAVAGDPNKGGYPSNLANSNYYNPVVDPWGMYSRQCVSYTAWKVYQKNGYMPYWGGRGNANQWPGNARAAGITVSSTPRAGSVGVIMAGQYGHVVWVESVNSNGTINISQYNYYNAGGSGWGHYSEMYNISPGAYDYYIYF